MSGPNDVLVDIKGRIDGPGGLKQASGQAKQEIHGLNEEAKKGNEIAVESARGQQLLAAAYGAVGLAVAAAGVATTAYIAVQLAAAKAYLQAAESLGTLGERYDMNVEQLSVMRVEAELNSTSVEKLAQGHQQLSSKMLAANSGNREAIALFKALGVEYEDGTGKLRATDEVMKDMHDRFSEMEEGPQRAAVAAKVFGKGLADDLLPWLTKTNEELAKNRTEAELLGLKISTETAKQVKEFDDHVKVLTLSVQGLGKGLAIDAVDGLVKVAERMRDARKEGGLLYTILEGLREGTLQLAGATDKAEMQKLLAQRDSGLKRLADMQARQANGRPSPVLADAITATQQALNALQDEIIAKQRVLDPTASTAGHDQGGGRGLRTAAPDAILKEVNERAGKGPRADPADLQRIKQQAAEELRQMKELADFERRGDMARLEREDKLEKAADDRYKALQKEAQAVRETLDPWEAYGRTLAKLNELQQEGLLTQEEYTQAVVDAGDKVEARMKKLTDAGVDGFTDLKNAIEGWGRDTSRTLAKTALDGEVSFKSLGDSARSFLEELLAIQIQRRIMDPALKAGTAALDQLFGANQYPVDPSFQGVGASPYHSGRGPGEFSAPRFVHPAYFERAPRHHSGIGPGEHAAVIRDDESVLTPGQMRALGNRTPNLVIQIKNESGVPLQAREAAPPVIDGETIVFNLLVSKLSKDGGARDAVRGMLAAPA